MRVFQASWLVFSSVTSRSSVGSSIRSLQSWSCIWGCRSRRWRTMVLYSIGASLGMRGNVVFSLCRIVLGDREIKQALLRGMRLPCHESRMTFEVYLRRDAAARGKARVVPEASEGIGEINPAVMPRHGG